MKVKILLLVIVSLMSVGCAGSVIPKQDLLKKSEIAGINRIDLEVTGTSDLSVMYSRMSGTNVGVMFGLIGASIGEAVKGGQDRDMEEALSNVEQADFKMLLIDNFVHAIEETHRFDVVSSRQISNDVQEKNFADYMEKEVQGVITLNVEEVSLRRGKDDLLYGFIHVRGRMHNVSNGSLIWDQVKEHTSSTGYPFDAYRNQKGLLKKTIEEVTWNVAIRLAQDIIYAN